MPSVQFSMEDSHHLHPPPHPTGLIFILIENGSVLPAGVFLIYQAVELDHILSSFPMKRFRRGYGMDDDEKSAYVNLYVPDEELQKHPLYSVIDGDVSGWPPTLVVTAQFDDLRDQGRKLTKKLEEVGKFVRYKCLKGALHACASLAGLEESMAETFGEIKRFVELLK
jgi:acetyl esterase